MGSALFQVMDMAILVDFDGTVTRTDASYAILKRYASEDWMDVEKEALDHRITILDALKIQAKMVKVSAEVAAVYLKENVELRDGFRELAEWCKESSVHLEICSDGFGYTIEVLLAHWGLDWIPWSSNRTIPDENGWKISFPHRKDGCPINANCKCSHLDRIKGSSDIVVFVGDGTTDECVSRKADIVFARDRLLEICQKDGRDCIPWKRWEEVLEKIQAM